MLACVAPSKLVPPTSAARTVAWIHGCPDLMTANRCSWSKHGTWMNLHGEGSLKPWRKRWVNRMHLSISFPAHRWLEPSKAQITTFLCLVTTHKLDYTHFCCCSLVLIQHISPAWSRSALVLTPPGHSTVKKPEISTPRRGSKAQVAAFLLRTSLNRFHDQGS